MRRRRDAPDATLLRSASLLIAFSLRIALHHRAVCAHPCPQGGEAALLIGGSERWWSRSAKVLLPTAGRNVPATGKTSTYLGHVHNMFAAAKQHFRSAQRRWSRSAKVLLPKAGRVVPALGESITYVGHIHDVFAVAEEDIVKALSTVGPVRDINRSHSERTAVILDVNSGSKPPEQIKIGDGTYDVTWQCWRPPWSEGLIGTSVRVHAVGAWLKAEIVEVETDHGGARGICIQHTDYPSADEEFHNYESEDILYLPRSQPPESEEVPRSQTPEVSPWRDDVNLARETPKIYLRELIKDAIYRIRSE